MSGQAGTDAQMQPGWLTGVKNAVVDTAESWRDTTVAVATGDSGVVEALRSDSHDEAAVRNIKNLGHMASTGIAAVGVVKGGMAAYATCGGLTALGVFGGALAAGAAGAFIGAGLVNHFALDEKLLDFLGAPKLAKSGPQPATVGDQIAHGSAFAGALCGLVAGVAVGALVAATICTGGAAAVIVGAVAAGAAGGGVGALVNGFFSKMATVTGKIITGSPNVFFEGRPVARVGDQVQCRKHSSVSRIAEGSETVFVNGLPLARIGHKTTCNASIHQGCKTIFADSTTGVYLKKDAEHSAREQAVISTAEVALSLGVGRLLSKLGLKCGEPVNPADGSYFDVRTDLEYPAALPLRLTRTYAGKDPVASVLGPRWICNWSQRLVFLADEPTANLEDGEGEVLQYPLGKGAEFNSRNLRAAHYHLRGTRQRARLFDSRYQQTLIFETTESHPHIGRLSAIEDRNNNRIDFLYENDHLRRVAHSDGEVFVVGTTPEGFIATVTRDGDGEPLLRYGYDSSGALTEARSLFGGEFHYAYTEQGWLNHWQDSGATCVDIAYDSEGRVVATQTPDGLYNDRFVYDSRERKTEYHDAEGGCFTYWFNANHQLIREQDPLGHITTHEVSGLDRRLSTTDPLGRVTRFDYDTFGHLMGETDGAGRTTRYAYDPHGQLTGIDYPDGTASAWTYDDRGNLIEAKEPDGHIRRFSYDDQGRLLTETGTDGTTTRLGYDRRGRLASLRNTLGETTRYHLDRWGRPRIITDPAGYSTHYEYDPAPDNPRADLSRILHPDGGEERLAYDSEGLPKTHVAPEGQTTRATYGAFDLLRTVTDPKGHATRLDYDNAARLTRITNAAGQSWRYRYDPAGRLAAETDWAGRVTSYTRDAVGRVIAKRLPDGSEQQLAWDDWDRITAVETARQKIVYEYDNADRLTRAATYLKGHPEPESDLRFTHDDKGRLIQEIQNGTVIGYRYDLAGHLASRTTPGGETTYTYDLLGRFKSLSSNGHGLEVTRDARGLETQRQYQAPEQTPRDALTLKQSYDACGRLTRQLVGRDRQLAVHDKLAQVSRRYRWDQSGRLVGVQDSRRGSYSCHYDPRDQIEQITRHTGLHTQTIEHYRYDALLNLTQSNGRTHRYEGGTVRSIGNSSYRYDIRGRVIEKRLARNGFRPQAWRYAWDDFDRLLQTHTPDGSVWHYTYDAFGRRIRKECIKPGERSARQTTRYLWQGATLAEEHRTNGHTNEINRWHYEPGTFHPVAKETISDAGEGSFYPLVTDHLGTPKELFDTEGNLLWQAEHELWGKAAITAKTGSNCLPIIDCNLRFQNQWEDEESGLYYNLHRYYDPDSGQYLSPDPIGLEGGLRTHGYVHDPMQWVDPLGLAGCPRKAIVVGEGMGRVNKAVKDLRLQGINAKKYQTWKKNCPMEGG